MLSCSQLKVFNHAYDLLMLIYQSSPNVSREYRSTLVEKIKNDVTELCMIIYRASNTQGRENREIQAAREMLVRINIECRMLGDLRQISGSIMAQIKTHTRSIDEQIEVWCTYNVDKSTPN